MLGSAQPPTAPHAWGQAPFPSPGDKPARLLPLRGHKGTLSLFICGLRACRAFGGICSISWKGCQSCANCVRLSFFFNF